MLAKLTRNNLLIVTHRKYICKTQHFKMHHCGQCVWSRCTTAASVCGQDALLLLVCVVKVHHWSRCTTEASVCGQDATLLPVCVVKMHHWSRCTTEASVCGQDAPLRPVCVVKMTTEASVCVPMKCVGSYLLIDKEGRQTPASGFHQLSEVLCTHTQICYQTQ